jgi:hypothetical protein
MTEERCYGRIIARRDDAIGRFENNSRFYLESRCPKTVSDGTKICSRCQTWKQLGMNKKDVYANHFGLVSDPLPPDCHIFDSYWYQSKVKDYGYPSESEMARAKKAQEEARGGVAQVPVPATEPKPEPEKKKLPATEPVPVPEVPAAEPKPEPEPEPAKKKRAPKKQQVPATEPVPASETVSSPPNATPKAKESNEPALQKEVVYIQVRRFTHNGRSYFLDPKKKKLYTVGRDKLPGTYHGRWNPESETIDTSFPDSDAE